MKEKKITLVAVGDMALFGDCTKIINENGTDFLFLNITSNLKGSDIVFGNLECPLSNKGTPNLNKINFCGTVEAIKGLKHCGFNVLSLANNHICDYGKEAFFDTINLIKENRINYIGAGYNLDNARLPVAMEIKGTKVLFLGYSCMTTHGQNYALKNQFGVVPLNMKLIEEDLMKARKRTDFIIVSLHWGIEGYHYPSPKQIKIAHQIIDLGANLILGHHPHVIQGLEVYNKGIIAYSLGNFIFPNTTCWIGNKRYFCRRNKENKKSFILKCELTKGKGINTEIIPVFLNSNLQPTVYEGIEKDNFLLNLNSLSERICNKTYIGFWKKLMIKKECSKPLQNWIRKGGIFKNICRLRLYHFKNIFKLMIKFVKLKFFDIAR